jgi:glycosyltransferase involved in cell wall biosynthesis
MSADYSKTINKKLLFYDTSLTTKQIGGVTKTIFELFNGINNVYPELKIIGLQRKKSSHPVPFNVKTLIRRFPYESSLWRNVIYPFYAFLNPKVPFLFPVNGKIPKNMPATTPKIMILHDVLPMSIPNYFKSEKDKKKYIKRTQDDLNRANMVFTISEWAKNEIIKYFKVKTEPIVIYNACTLNSNFDRNNTIYDLGKTDDYFIYCGRYDKRKGIEQLVKIFIDLHKTQKISSKLYITGHKHYLSDEFEQDIKVASELGIIKELGFVKDEDLAKLLTKSKGMIYPSKHEGFGLPPLEAMQVGCPVITCYSSALPEVCGDAVLYADIDNSEEFSQQIIRLVSDKELRKNLIQKGFERLELFSWDKSAKIFLDSIKIFY